MALDRFILASNLKRIETRFSMAKLPELVDYTPSYNIAPGDKSYIINNHQTKEILLYDFRLRGNGDVLPFVRAEGDRNSEDNPDYKGSKAIFLKPEFNRLIRYQRCLVLADAFVVGIDESKPHLVYLRDKKRPFAFAGIWDRITGKPVCVENFSYSKMQRLGKKESDENKAHFTLEERMKTGK